MSHHHHKRPVPAYNCAGKCTGNLFGKRRCIAQNAFWPFKKIMVSPLHLYTPSRPSCLFKHINFYGFPAGVLLYQRHLGEIIIEKPFFCVINLLSKWVLSLGILVLMGKLNYHLLHPIWAFSHEYSILALHVIATLYEQVKDINLSKESNLFKATNSSHF